MGIKGDKLTKEASILADLLVEKLSPIGGISTKKMFGGHGIFHEGKMFCIIDSKAQAYMKADDSNKADYEATASQQHSKMPYYSIPEEVLNNVKMLIIWANKSISIAK